MLHDLAESGVVRNALAIAGAAHREGMNTEIWVVDGAGPLIAQIPHGVGLVTLGGLGSKWKNRRLAGVAAMGNLARAYRERRPKVALSAGNHFHITASAAYFFAGSPNSVRLHFRASNPPFRGRDIRFGAVLAWLYRLRFMGARRIISVSAELGEILVKTIRLDPSSVVTIANSIDLEAVAERAAEAPEHPWFAAGEPPVLLGIGRLAPQKNFSLLIEAFAQVRRARPLRLAIIGDGAGDELAKLQALAANLGLTSADVWFAGHQSNPLKFLAHAGLFVLSSNWEGMSNVLLEAMACGCPIVATDCPTGVREQLDNGRIGPIVPINDPEKLANAIARRLEEPRGSEGLIEYVARFDHDNMLAAYTNLFRSEAGDGATV
ncbi:MAG: glycosyltransferase [Aestuariivirga sp.]|nr:glycosyltransferase [Aestuariivirga sp.]